MKILLLFLSMGLIFSCQSKYDYNKELADNYQYKIFPQWVKQKLNQLDIDESKIKSINITDSKEDDSYKPIFELLSSSIKKINSLSIKEHNPIKEILDFNSLIDERYVTKVKTEPSKSFILSSNKIKVIQPDTDVCKYFQSADNCFFIKTSNNTFLIERKLYSLENCKNKSKLKEGALVWGGGNNGSLNYACSLKDYDYSLSQMLKEKLTFLQQQPNYANMESLKNELSK